MELRRLRYFLTVAEELHVGRAAERLRLAQPGLSQQLRVLERELGTTLLDRRNPRRIALTAAGQALAEHGVDLLEHHARIEQQVAEVAAGRAGQLRVSLSRSASHGLPARIISTFREQHPQVELTVTTSYTALNLGLLDRGETDVAFVRPPLTARPSAVRATTVSCEPFLVALPAGHWLTGHDRVSTRDLLRLPLVWWPREQAPGVWDAMLTQIYGTPTTSAVARWEPDEERMLAAVADGVGITFLPDSRARTLRPQQVTYRRCTEPEPTISIGLAWRRHATNPALAPFLEVAKRYSEAVESDGSE